MRKVMPCRICKDGVAKLGTVPYVMEMVPMIYASKGIAMHYRCSKCKKMQSLTRQEFNAIPNTELTVVET